MYLCDCSNLNVIFHKAPHVLKWYLLGHEGSSGDRPYRDLNNHTSKRDATLLPKTLRLWVYGSSFL